MTATTAPPGALPPAALPREAPPPPRRRARLPSPRVLLPLLPLVLLAAAGWALHHELKGFRLHDVARSVALLPGGRLGWAVAATAANYLLLTVYDELALRHVRRSLPYHRVGPTAFIAYAFGHNLGMAALSSGSVRLRLYTAFGLSAVEVAQVAAFTSLTFLVGGLVVGGAALLLAAGALPAAWHLTPTLARVLGAALLLLAAGYVALCALMHGRTLTLRGHALRLPSPRMALAQAVLSSLDWVLAALVLFLLLPPGAALSLPALLSLFLLAQAAGLVSQVPGGLGVFDSVVVVSLAATLAAPTVLGLLVVYRLVYYLGPFLLAAALLVGSELGQRRRQLAQLARGAHSAFAPVVPVVAAAAAFLAGMVLLFAGAASTGAWRLAGLEHLAPRPLRELSHFLSSLVGVALLLVARGLYRRLDAAYVVALALLGGGALLALLRGGEVATALLLLLLLVLLLPFHAQFYRRASLLAEPLSEGWWVSVVAVVGACVWLGLLAARHAEVPGEPWWHLVLRPGAPPGLRAAVVAVVAVGAAGVAQLLRPHVPAPALPTGAELARVRPLVARAPEARAHRALAGDRPLLLAPGHAAFLVYAVQGRCWVALGEPVGPPAAATELAWQLLERADEHHGWAVFHDVGETHLARYLDMGLSLLALGEEATVPLVDFGLEAPGREGLREAVHRARQEGLTFELVPRDEVPALLPQLRAMPGAGARLSPRALVEGPVALAWQAERLVGLASVWAPRVRSELSVGGVRLRPDAPAGTLDFLLVALLRWGRAEGYARFDLGLAPRAGAPGQQLDPTGLWAHTGPALSRLGVHFASPQALRQHLERFAPDWAPRFLAAPGGLALPRVLDCVGALVAEEA